jgi:hypothetical protein
MGQLPETTRQSTSGATPEISPPVTGTRGRDRQVQAIPNEKMSQTAVA